MHITRLELKNFRTFSHLLLEDIPNLVVLVSPNGRGKSSILEAIAGIHELVRPYHQDAYPFKKTWQQRHISVWPEHLSPPVKQGKRRAEIQLQIEATGDEVAYLKSSNMTELTGKARFIIEDGYITEEQANDTIKKLFLYHNPTAGVGFVDYIRPIRFYANRRLGDFAADLCDDRTKQIFTEFHQPYNQHNKFAAFKSFIVGTQLDDLSYLQETAQRRDSLDVFRAVFDRFFAPKKFVGYRLQPGGQPQVVVGSPFGEHDTDYLSDGEKEILHIMGHLYRFRQLHNIILWDTPEMHLNAALESRLYAALNHIASNNQYWIATHSLEFIDAVPLENIFVIQNDGASAKIERASGNDRKARVAIYQDMGARVGLQLVSSVIAFVEGKQAHSDKRILDRLVAESVSGVNFVAGGSCDNVLSAGTKANDLLEEVCSNGDFLAIVDRDYRNDGEVDEVERRYKGQVFIWHVHEIENLLLNENVVFRTLQFHDCLSIVPSLATPDDIRQALLKAAMTRREWIAADWVAWDFDKAIRPLPRRIGGDNPKMHLSNYATRLRDRTQAIGDPNTIDGLFQQKLAEVDQLIATGCWQARLPGKEILKKFLEPYSSAMVNLDNFIRTATSAIKENEIVIPELERLKATIQTLQLTSSVK